MNFNIDTKPPPQEEINQVIYTVSNEIKQLSRRDTLITFVLIILTSLGAGAVAFWMTGNYYYAGGAVAFFPVMGTILSIFKITQTTGFRSAADKLSELNNELASLSPVSKHDMKDIEKLCRTHRLVNNYQGLVSEQGRSTVNGELAMYWEFDTSTMAKTAKGRDYLEKARESVKP